MNSTPKYDVKNSKIEHLQVYNFLLTNLRPNSKVLELGSATGYLTRYMQENLSCQVTCIEIDAESAEKCKPFSKRVIVADLDQNEWIHQIDEKFDFITSLDVLEHLRNPDKVLKALTTFLKEDGKIITSVPNLAHNSIVINLLKGKFEYKNTGLLDNTHIHFFTKKSLYELFHNNSFYSTANEYCIKIPTQTEFNVSYWGSIIKAPFLPLRAEGSIYQYLNVWEFQKEEIISRKSQKILKKTSLLKLYIRDLYVGLARAITKR
jgi:O-antigen biosynthesis protein